MSNLLPNDWEITTLEKNSQLITDGSHFSPITSECGFPIATVQNMADREINISSCRKISKMDFDNLVKGNCSPEYDDVLFSKDGTIGKTFVYKQKQKIVLLSSIAIIRLKKNQINPDYCTQYLQSSLFYSQLENAKSGSAIRRVVLKDIKQLELPMPPLHEQQKIAAILTSVDDVIEKTQAQINKLKDLKTGMMQEMLTCGIGVDGKPHTEFKDSPVGRIPKVWTHRMIGDVSIKVGSGVTPKGGSEAYVDFGIPLIRSQNVYSDGLRLGNVSYITQKQHEKMRNSQLKPKDVLLNITGASIGRCFYLDDTFEEGNVNQHVCIIRINAEVIDNVYLSYVLNSDIGQRQIMSLQAGGNREGLNFQQIKEINIPLPSLGEQKAITKSLKAVENNIFKLEEKNTKNQAMKKALMQDLLTGKVRVNVD